MGDVKPWEPVRVQYTDHTGWTGTDWTWDENSEEDVLSSVENDEGWHATVTLANGQKIIVRAKS